ncbi:MAG: hypothetical protein R3B96_22770 [Pirellulaceae bacterium]
MVPAVRPWTYSPVRQAVYHGEMETQPRNASFQTIRSEEPAPAQAPGLQWRSMGR